MERREFSRVLTAGALAASGVLAWPALAQGKKPESGTDYLTLDKTAPVDTPDGKVEVLEFFWYSCPHCNSFEPQLESWIKQVPKDVVVRRVPVRFRADFEAQQRLYYTLEALNKVEALHRKVFYAVHVEKQALNTSDSIATWAEKQGLAKGPFIEMFNSFGVANKARRAAQLQDLYKVQGVPSLGIAGRYYTDGTLAGSMERALQVTNVLIADARRAKPAA